MGLGLLGRGVGDAMFLAKHGAELTITDLKTKDQLKESVNKLAKFKNIRFVLGEHRLEDFRNQDFVLKAAGVPLNSPYIAEARKYRIPIKMSASWLMELMPKVKTIGITGTRGKSTVTHLIYKILKAANKNVHLGGNVRGLSTLALLDKIKPKDYLVLELDSWQLQGFGESQISPNVSVFTTFMDDHLNYYGGDRNKYFQDKANIFKYQKQSDVFVVGEDLAISKFKMQNAKLRIAKRKGVPKNWRIKIPGEHNKLNIACAIEVAKALKITDKIIRKATEDFKGVEGRLQYVKTIKGVKIYNDNNATTPDATLAALKALGKVVLIMGGADKNLDTSLLVREIPKYCKAVVLLPGSGSEKLDLNCGGFDIKFQKAKDLKSAVLSALKFANKRDIILFSPAFASFGLFKNEYDRNDQFVSLLKSLRK